MRHARHLRLWLSILTWYDVTCVGMQHNFQIWKWYVKTFRIRGISHYTFTNCENNIRENTKHESQNAAATYPRQSVKSHTHIRGKNDERTVQREQMLANAGARARRAWIERWIACYWRLQATKYRIFDGQLIYGFLLGYYDSIKEHLSIVQNI